MDGHIFLMLVSKLLFFSHFMEIVSHDMTHFHYIILHNFSITTIILKRSQRLVRVVPTTIAVISQYIIDCPSPTRRSHQSSSLYQHILWQIKLSSIIPKFAMPCACTIVRKLIRLTLRFLHVSLPHIAYLFTLLYILMETHCKKS